MDDWEEFLKFEEEAFEEEAKEQCDSCMVVGYDEEVNPCEECEYRAFSPRYRKSNQGEC